MKKYLAALVLVLTVAAVSVAVCPGKIIIEGKITAIDTTEKTLVVEEKTIATTEDTVILNAGEPGSFDDLKVDQLVRVVAVETDDELTAKKICIKGDCEKTRPKCRKKCPLK